MSVNPKLLNYPSPAPNQASCFFHSWKQRPLRVACVRSGEAWDHFLMRHQVPLGMLSPERAGGSLEHPGNWLQGNKEDVDAGGLIPLHSRDPFPAPPTKARGPGYWHMPLSPWILQSKKIRSESQNPFPRENHLSKSWYYWCWGKLRGACNLFNKSRTVFAGAPEFSCLLRSILRGWEGPPVINTNVWSAMRLLQGSSDDPKGFSSLVVSRAFFLKFFVSFRIHYKRHNYISFSSLIEYISYKWWFTTWKREEAVSPRSLASAVLNCISSHARRSARPCVSLACAWFEGIGRSPLAHKEGNSFWVSLRWVSEDDGVLYRMWAVTLKNYWGHTFPKSGPLLHVWLL